MTSFQENLLSGLIVLLGAYSLYAMSMGNALLSIGVAAIVFAITKSKAFTVAVLVVEIIFYMKSHVTHAPLPAPVPARAPVPLPVSSSGPVPMPMTMEGFQARDPASVHTRLENVKVAVPTVQNITGVLESPNILDNSPLMGIESIAHEGVPGASIPASAKARVLIYPPPEHSMPPHKESMMNGMISNPYLQTGQDRMAEEVAHAEKGTDIYAGDGSTIQGVAMGAGPAF